MEWIPLKIENVIEDPFAYISPLVHKHNQNANCNCSARERKRRNTKGGKRQVASCLYLLQFATPERESLKFFPVICSTLIIMSCTVNMISRAYPPDFPGTLAISLAEAIVLGDFYPGNITRFHRRFSPRKRISNLNKFAICTWHA